MMRQVPFADAMRWKYPEWVVVVLSCDHKQRVNAMLAGWAMICSGSPPMFAIAVAKSNYTHDVICDTREFVVAFPSQGMEEDVLYCGNYSGRDGRKLEKTNLCPTPAAQVQVPLLSGCRVNLECELAETVSTGDHSIFVGHVVASHIDSEAPPNIVNFGESTLAPAMPLNESGDPSHTDSQRLDTSRGES